MVEKVAAAGWQTVKQTAQVATQAAKTVAHTVVETAKVAKDCLMRFFNWSWGKVKGLFGGNQPQLNPA
jgi:hypothetical protein